jgi:hypothetical protein
MIGTMPRQWRAIAIFWTLAIWFGSFFGAVAEQQRAHRLAANPVVTATVREAWSEHQKGGPVPYAHLVYDRKQWDGKTVHCDVPWVNVGGLGRMLSAGDTIMIAPLPNECWEPDLICETCAPWTPRHIAMMYVVSASSGLLCVFLIWQAIRDMRRNDTTNAKVA